ncbi:MAG: hypothetical protein IPK44_13025 [Candidatus Accumulibacter sp.]|uniref:hypothetical protein n=1 Tax=Accumulibacter sp. TaxID=2053492 RepID=UPI00258953B4|nr:hypothetical protein [Accumulibacter sp.]MBK8115377.1 hypothetical protein [Accumulibacter sp.]
MPALGDYFAAIIARHPEVAACACATQAGRVLAEYGTARSGWIERAAGDARVAAATDERFVAHRLWELAVDVGIVLVVAALLFRELLAALLGAAAPTARRYLNVLQSAPPAAVLFILSEGFACLPASVRAIVRYRQRRLGRKRPSACRSPSMLCFALATPFLAGRWTDRQVSPACSPPVSAWRWSASRGRRWPPPTGSCCRRARSAPAATLPGPWPVNGG